MGSVLQASRVTFWDEDRARMVPVTYLLCPRRTSENLDHAEMLALAHAYDRWACEATSISASSRTELLLWSADLEAIAEWAGLGWRASYPIYPPTISKVMARKLLNGGYRLLSDLFNFSEWRWGEWPSSPSVFRHYIEDS